MAPFGAIVAWAAHAASTKKQLTSVSMRLELQRGTSSLFRILSCTAEGIYTTFFVIIQHSTPDCRTSYILYMTNINKIERLSKNQVQKAMISGRSLSGALKLLKVPHNDPRIRKVFSTLLEKYDLPRSYEYLSNRTTFTQEELVAAVEKSISVTEVLNNLGFKNHGANYKTIKKCIIQWNINIGHFDRRAAAIKNKKVYSTQDIFCKDSTYARGALGKAVRSHKIFQVEKCSKCNITDWNNESLSLQIDHINGINTDNRIENLRLLCPNCHSQTPNFSGRSSKKVGRM